MPDLSRFAHEKDCFGNDLYYLDGGGITIAPVGNINDLRQQLKHIKNMTLRDDDVLMVAYPKSGNNWIHHMMTMLNEGTTNISSELLPSDNYVFLDQCGGGNELPPPVKSRVLWSHLPFRFLPRDVTDKKLKVVWLRRNPKDVFVSLYCYLNNFGLPVGYQGTWTEFFQVMLEKGWWYGHPFDYVADWEREMDTHPDVPIFPVTYEDAKQDPVGTVKKLNEFLGTKRDPQLCQAIADKCTFLNMPHLRQLGAGWRESTGWKGDQFSAFYRKGVIGDWKNWFTVAQNEQFEQVLRSRMNGSKLKFVYE